MALKNCSISFENCPHGVFIAGETVSGTVNLNMTKKKKYASLMLKISGEANVTWKEKRKSIKSTETNKKSPNHIEFTGKDIYFQTYINLLPMQIDNSIANILNPGKHQYNFTFVLPQNLPSSYEGTYGRLSYMCKVSVKRNKKKDLVYRTSFTVLSNADLNFYPHLRTPISQSMSKDFYLLFSRQGVLNVKIEIPKSGFVPDQIIPIRCHAKNEGKVKISEVKYLLIRLTSFRTTIPYENGREEKIEVAQCPCEGIGPDEEKIINAFMIIPPLPPSSLPSIISIIQVKYLIKVKAKVFGIHMASGHLTCEIPITIGTAPFIEENVEQPLQQPSTSMELGAPPAYTEFAPRSTIYESNSDIAEEEDDDDDDEVIIKSAPPQEDEIVQPIGFTALYPTFPNDLKKNPLD